MCFYTLKCPCFGVNVWSLQSLGYFSVFKLLTFIYCDAQFIDFLVDFGASMSLTFIWWQAKFINFLIDFSTSE